MTREVMPEMCATCPFRPRSKYAFLAGDLTKSALTDRSRICHSTGGNNAIHRRTGKKPKICRGTRDLQLQVFFRLGVIAAPTDQAWEAAWKLIKKKKLRGSAFRR